jgi:uncharacterized protein (DUF1778 family)
MAKSIIEHSERVDFRIRPEDKQTIARAADLTGVGLAAFIRQQALAAAKEIIDQENRIVLSERDSLKLLDLLDNPPEPSPYLLAAAKRLYKER